MTINAQYFNDMATMAAIIVVLLAMYTDIRWRKIANRLTVPAAIAGLLLHSIGSGWYGLLLSALGLGLGLAIMIVPFIFGKMGAGDVKLMGALGALLGAYSILNVTLYTAVMGGILAIGVALYNIRSKDTANRVWNLLLRMLGMTGRVENTDDEPTSIHIPYGVAIGAGTFCLLILGRII